MCGLAASSHNTHKLLVFVSFVNHAVVDKDVSIVVSKEGTKSPACLAFSLYAGHAFLVIF